MPLFCILCKSLYIATMKLKKQNCLKTTKNTVILLCVLLFANNPIAAQFQKIFSQVNLSEIKQLTDSGYIAMGWRNQGGVGTQDLCLVRLNSSGDTIWTKNFGESDDVTGSSMDITPDSGYILVGRTYATASGLERIYLIRTNSNGDTLWTKKLGGVGGNDGRCIRRTFDGGYIISGEMTSSGANPSDIYVVKIDSVGNVQWSRGFGGPNNDLSYSIIQTADSGYLALGTLNAFMVDCDLVLIKMNSFGDTLWTKAYGHTGGQEFGFDIIENNTHGFAVVGGTFSFGSGNGDYYLIITDSVGNLLWSKTYGGTDTDYAESIIQTPDSNYVIAGYTVSFGVATWAQYVIKLNAIGDTIWSQTYDDTHYGIAWDIIQTMDGGYAVAGEEQEFMKLNSLGKAGCLEKRVATLITNPSTMQLNKIITVTVPTTTTSGTTTTIESGVGNIITCTGDPTNIGQTASENNAIQVIPNPATNSFTIHVNTNGNEFVEILSAFGERVYYDNFMGSKTNINCRHFSNGIYFIKIFDGLKSYCKKLIIEH